jgi:hypothetical protein
MGKKESDTDRILMIVLPVVLGTLLIVVIIVIIVVACRRHRRGKKADTFRTLDEDAASVSSSVPASPAIVFDGSDNLNFGNPLYGLPGKTLADHHHHHEHHPGPDHTPAYDRLNSTDSSTPALNRLDSRSSEPGDSSTARLDRLDSTDDGYAGSPDAMNNNPAFEKSITYMPGVSEVTMYNESTIDDITSHTTSHPGYDQTNEKDNAKPDVVYDYTQL